MTRPRRDDMRLMAPSTPAPAPVDRGRMLTADDVREILPPMKGGKKLSRKTIITSFLPEKRRKIGRLVFWFERDIDAYLSGESHAA